MTKIMTRVTEMIDGSYWKDWNNEIKTEIMIRMIGINPGIKLILTNF